MRWWLFPNTLTALIQSACSIRGDGRGAHSSHIVYDQPIFSARASYGNELIAIWLSVGARWDSGRNHIHLAESN